jgi:putative hydroxymethylpyrimidine transport system substrate-binding protein
MTMSHPGLRRPWFALLICFLLIAPYVASGPSRTAADEPVKIKVALDWYPNANHAGLFLAKERGYFEDAGLDVEFYTPADPTTVLQTVGAGRDDFGISYQTDILLAREQGVPVVSVAALVQHPLLCVMATKDQHITRPHDLVGKTVGYPGIPSQEAFLSTMLAADGASLDDVNLVNVGFDLVPAAISGRANAVMGAYWTHETILAEREGHPVDIMRVEDWGVPDYYELVLTANEKTVHDRPEVVTAFLGAVQRGYQDAIADQPAALDALQKDYPDMDRDVETQGLALLAPEWTDHVPSFGTQTAERWTAFGDWMKQNKLISADLDISAAYTTTLLPAPVATPAATPSS